MWVLIYLAVSGTIDVYEFKHLRECEYAMLRYLNTEYKYKVYCQYREPK